MQFNMPENTYIRCELQKIPGQKGVYIHTKNWKSAKKTIVPEVKKPAVLVFFPPIGRGASVICIIRFPWPCLKKKNKKIRGKNR